MVSHELLRFRKRLLDVQVGVALIKQEEILLTQQIHQPRIAQNFPNMDRQTTSNQISLRADEVVVELFERKARRRINVAGIF